MPTGEWEVIGVQALPHCKCKEEGKERGWGSKSPQEKRQREDDGFWLLSPAVCVYLGVVSVREGPSFGGWGQNCSQRRFLLFWVGSYFSQ